MQGAPRLGLGALAPGVAGLDLLGASLQRLGDQVAGIQMWLGETGRQHAHAQPPYLRIELGAHVGHGEDILATEQADGELLPQARRICHGDRAVQADLLVSERFGGLRQWMVWRHGEHELQHAQGLALQAGGGVVVHHHADGQIGFARGQRRQRAGKRLRAQLEAGGRVQGEKAGA